MRRPRSALMDLYPLSLPMPTARHGATMRRWRKRRARLTLRGRLAAADYRVARPDNM
jgi:hypothetical protein